MVQVRLIVIVCYSILITVKTKLTICKKDDALASQFARLIIVYLE